MNDIPPVDDLEPQARQRRGFLGNVIRIAGAEPMPVGHTSFSAEQAAFTETLVNTMCPPDALTPSGVDCGLALFIDRQLAGAFGQGAGRYMNGTPAPPQTGLQLPFTPQQFFNAGVAAANRQC